MLRGRKRKLPSFFIPESFFHGSDSEDDHHEDQIFQREQVVHHVQVEHPGQIELQEQDDLPTDDGGDDEDQEEVGREEEGGRDPRVQVQNVFRHAIQEEYLVREPQLERELLRDDPQDADHQRDVLHHEIDPQHAPRELHAQEDQEDQEDQQDQQEQHEQEGQEEQQEQEEQEEQEDGDVHEDDNSDGDDDHDAQDEVDGNIDDYYTILDALSNEWMNAELDHTISKVASNKMWQLAFKFLPKLLEAKRIQRITRKTPAFKQIREKMYENKTPKVNLELAYRNKDTDEVEKVNSEVTPKSRFPPHLYEKMYEIATVKVIILPQNFLITFF